MSPSDAIPVVVGLCAISWLAGLVIGMIWRWVCRFVFSWGTGYYGR